MKVKQLEYKKLQSFGTFNNHTVGIIVELDEDDRPDDVLARMKNWVEKELDRKIGELEQIPF